MNKDYSDNQLKEILKGKFKDEYLSPPVGAWNSIEGKLSTSIRTRKPLFFWLFPLSVLFTIGGGIALKTFWITDNTNSKKSKNTEWRQEMAVQKEITSTESNPNSEKKEKTESNSIFSKKNKVIGENQPQKYKSNLVQNEVKVNTEKSSFLLKSKNEKVRKIDNETQSNKPASDISAVKGHTLNKTKTEKFTSESTKFNLNVASSGPKRADANKTLIEQISSHKEKEITKVGASKIELDANTITNGISSDKTELQIKSSIPKESNTLNTTENEKDLKFPIKLEESEILIEKNKVDNIELVELDNGDKEAPIIPLKSSNIKNKFRFDFYLGKGKSFRRTTIGSTKPESTTLLLADKIARMNNTAMGFNVLYQLSPYFGIRTGFALGTDRFRTRLFTVKIANTDLDKELGIASADGLSKSNGFESNGLTANEIDSSTYQMRIFHRQGYLSIPFAFMVNTKKQPGKFYYYATTGVDFRVKGKGRNVLIIKDSEATRSIAISRFSDEKRIHGNWNFGLGLAYPFKANFDLFMELNYTTVLTNGPANSYLNTKTNNFQFLIGLRF